MNCNGGCSVYFPHFPSHQFELADTHDGCVGDHPRPSRDDDEHEQKDIQHEVLIRGNLHSVRLQVLATILDHMINPERGSLCGTSGRGTEDGGRCFDGFTVSVIPQYFLSDCVEVFRSQCFRMQSLTEAVMLRSFGVVPVFSEDWDA